VTRRDAAGPDRGEPGTLADRYARRAADGAVVARDSVLHPATAAMLAERQRTMWAMLGSLGWTASTLARRRVLEVGCGDGGNLLDLVRGGCDPARLVGVELLSDRAAAAQSRLPAGCTVIAGDLVALAPAVDGTVHHPALPPQGFDLVLLFTVLSSVLAPGDREALAEAVWRCVAPGGAVLVYDFVVDNPRNPDVRRVTLAELRRLWPQAALGAVRALTLAPPLARRLGRATPWAYGLLAALPGFRLHRMVALVREPT
jgi:SAM-dependent methyltransferase